MRRVVLALIHHEKKSFLMQLRDFKPTIIHPGHWGSFGGGMESGETSVKAMYRELREELEFRPPALEFLRTHRVERDHALIDVYSCPVYPATCRFVLGEGQEFDWFHPSQILSGTLPSKLWQRCFPVTPTLPELITQFLHSESEMKA